MKNKWKLGEEDAREKLLVNKSFRSLMLLVDAIETLADSPESVRTSISLSSAIFLLVCGEDEGFSRLHS